MWVCPSCQMENDDSDLNCYMCGEKRPHIAPVRKPKEPASVTEIVLQSQLVQEAQQACGQEPIADGGIVEQEECPPVYLTDIPEEHVQTDDPENKTAITLIFDRNEESADENKTVVAPKRWMFTPPVFAKDPQEEVDGGKEGFDPFAAGYDSPEPAVRSVEPVLPVQPVIPPRPVDDVFGIFSTNQPQEPAEKAPWMNNPPMQPDPVDVPPVRNKKTAESKVFSFATVLFSVALFVWIVGFGFFAIVRFFSGDAESIPQVIDSLQYAFETKVSALTEIEIPALFDKIMSLLGSL